MKFRIAALAFCVLALRAQAATYTLEPNYTQGIFSWDHLGFSHPTGQFAQGTGMLEFDAMNPTMASLQVTIPLASIATGVPDLDEHLKSEDFFDVAKFPTATFASMKVEQGMGKERIRVHGNLTIHGVTRPVTLEVTLLKVGSNARTGVPTVGFTATASVKRSDFGLGAFVPQVGDEIQIRLTTQAADAKAQAAYLEKQEAQKK